MSLQFDCPQGCGAKITVLPPNASRAWLADDDEAYNDSERRLGALVIGALLLHAAFDCSAIDDQPYQHPAPESMRRRP